MAIDRCERDIRGVRELRQLPCGMELQLASGAVMQRGGVAAKHGKCISLRCCCNLICFLFAAQLCASAMVP